MFDMPETPQLPEEVRRNRDVARFRTNELQGIFVSQHAADFEALQARLEALDSEEATLRASLASLTRELDEATEQRRAKDGVWENANGGETTEGGGSMLPESTDAWQPSRSPQATVQLAMTARKEPGRTPSAAATPRLLAGSRENPMSPILNRRRAEARLREATAAHETSMSQMTAAIAEIERRTHKQKCWMESVEKRVLDSEMEKVRVRVRLDKASQRVKSLSKELSSAYGNVVHLLEERLKLQDAKARNEALLTYLDVVGKSDFANESAFHENRAELCQAIKLVHERDRLEEQLEELVSRADELIRFATSAQKECQELGKANQGLQAEWVRVPALLKDVRLSNANRMKAARMHPATAMQNIAEALSSSYDELREFSDKLSKALQYDTVDHRPNTSWLVVDWEHAKPSRRASM